MTTLTSRLAQQGVHAFRIRQRQHQLWPRLANHSDSRFRNQRTLSQHRERPERVPAKNLKIANRLNEMLVDEPFQPIPN